MGNTLRTQIQFQLYRHPSSMTKLHKRKPRVPILKFVLLSFTTAAILLLTGKERALARSNDQSTIKNLLQDTLVSVSGKIVDSITNTPIPFTTISFYKDGSIITTIVSNEKGEFSTVGNHTRLRVLISAIGYQDRRCYLAPDHQNLLRLVPAGNLLPNVIVSSKARKKPNAYRIIKNVGKHFEQNYGAISFDQRFKINSVIRNYDSTKSELNNLLDLHFDDTLKSMRVKTWQEDTVVYEPLFLQFLGPPRLRAGNIVPRTDILRKGMVIGANQIKDFDFRILAHYQDKIYGSVFRVSFKPLSIFTDFFLKGPSYADLPLGYLNGEMLIREEDYAVISLKYIWELKVEPLNAALEKAYHSRYWKADKLNKIISASRVYKEEYAYSRDTVSGKYFIQAIKTDCYDTGYQIENERKVQLFHQLDVSSLGVENILDK
jgi:hypothetical protein